MLRTATSHLLIAIVLVCPYLCLGEAVGEIIVTCHGCGSECFHDQCQPNDETPDAPSRSDSDCLCHGAITDGVRSVEFDLDLSLNIDWIGGTTLTPAIPTLFADTSLEPPHHFPPFSTGWDVCVLTCALLL